MKKVFGIPLYYFAGFPVQIAIFLLFVKLRQYIYLNFEFVYSVEIMFCMSVLASIAFVLFYDVIKKDSMGLERSGNSNTVGKSYLFKLFAKAKRKGEWLLFITVFIFDPAATAIRYRKEQNKYKGLDARSFSLLLLSSAFSGLLWASGFSLVSFVKSLF